MTRRDVRLKAVSLGEIALITVLVLAGCRTHRDTKRAGYEPLVALEARFGPLITAGNHPTPDQHGTGDRIGFFGDGRGTVWGVPLSITSDGAVVGCAPATLDGAAVTDQLPAATTIIGATNEPTGWRGGTGRIELVLRQAGGAVHLQPISGGRLRHGPVCWAQVPPGPVQELYYYRITAAR